MRKPLFDRLGKRVRLTEAGKVLLARARNILAARMKHRRRCVRMFSQVKDA